MIGARLLCLPLVAALAACSGESGATAGDEPRTSSSRSGRFGSLRDFVLVERSDRGARGALFVDRFEVTQSDWQQFARTDAGKAVAAERVRSIGEDSLPASGMDHAQARAFAHWRFARLPSSAEWQLVALGDGRAPFPWGRRQDATRANTGELAFGEATPVGTFESGRRAGSDSPYDLVGNVREWTDTIPTWWCEQDLDLPLSFSRCQLRAQGAPAMACWSQVGGMLPLGVIAASGGLDVPRVVIGGDFETPMTDLYAHQVGGAWRQRTGLRIYTSAGELLSRLLADGERPSAQELAQLEDFVRRGRHREVLLRALDASEIVVDVPENSVADRVLRLLRTKQAQGR